MKRGIFCVLSAVLIPLLNALEMGADAPSLDGVTTVKGSVPDFSSQWTVVEFWATWCGPCRRSIPHLTKLNELYGDELAVVGLSDESEDTVRAFVAKQGDAMGYAVGVAPKAVRGRYMAGQSGIPKAFLVSPEGKIAWIGHPQAMDPILTQALTGTLDTEHMRRLQPLEGRLKGALRSRNAALIAEAADAVLALDPAHEEALQVRVAVARQAGEREPVREAYARIDAETLSPADAERLAYAMLTDPDLRFRFPELALAFVTRALTEDPTGAQTLALRARLSYVLGKLEEAIVLQSRAAEIDSKAGAVLGYYRSVEALRLQQ